MKLTIERAALMAALAAAASVVERRNTIPILANVRLDADGEGGGRLRLLATNLDQQYRTGLTAGVETAGAITAPAHQLDAIIRAMPEGCQISLEAVDGKLIVKAGRSRYTLNTLPVDDFPSLPEVADGVRFSIPAPVLHALLKGVRMAVSAEETRYYLNGVYLGVRQSGNQGGPAGLYAYATNGHILARRVVTLPEGATDMPDIIIPTIMVDQMLRRLEGRDSAVELHISATRLAVVIGPVDLMSKAIDGQFPDAERVIPAGENAVLTVQADALLTAVHRAALVASEKTRSVKFSLEHDTLVLTCTSPENGQAVEELPCAWGGAPLDVGYNAAYVRAVVDMAGGDDVMLMISEAAAPAWIRAVETPRHLLHALAVIMPMRI